MDPGERGRARHHRRGSRLIWAALGFFSVLESAFNIVYGLPNRAVRPPEGARLVLTAATAGRALRGARRSARSASSSPRTRRASAARSPTSRASPSRRALVLGVRRGASTGSSPNARDPLARDAPGRHLRGHPPPGELPGPAALRAGDAATSVSLQAFGGLVLLLVWLYLMANMLVLGAEVNWCLATGARSRRRAAEGWPGSRARRRRS